MLLYPLAWGAHAFSVVASLFWRVGTFPAARAGPGPRNSRELPAGHARLCDPRCAPPYRLAMDGIHDLGGMVGFGPIGVESDEPTFHHAWEATAFRLNVAAIAMLRAYNADEYRHAIERMEPAHYLQASYYERVLTGVATLLVEKGLLDRADLERRAGGTFPIASPARANTEDGRRPPDAPRFGVGDQVRVVQVARSGHTRVPRYVRGRSGVVVHVAPPFWYPDASAHGLTPRREATYHVEFDAPDLWGEDAEESAPVVVDLWETYLQPAGSGGAGER